MSTRLTKGGEKGGLKRQKTLRLIDRDRDRGKDRNRDTVTVQRQKLSQSQRQEARGKR